MLVSLHIEDYALIDRLEVEFTAGLNVLTGETGSGKSIVVDALGLLFGERADLGAVRSGAERAWVSGIFQRPPGGGPAALEALGLGADAEPLILRREIGGRSRVFINDMPATVAALRQLAPWLGEVHAQNQALVSFTPAAQLALLDEFAGDAAGRAPQLRAAFEEWREWRAKWADWERDDQERLRQADLWRYQRQELAEAQVRAGEDEELERERRRLANAEKIAAAAQTAYAVLYDAPEAAAAGVKLALKQVQELSRLDPAAAMLAPRLESARSELEDIAEALREWTEQADASPERLAAIEERLALLDRLKRKYGPTLAEVAAYAADLEQKLDAVEHADLHRQEARAKTEAAARQYAALAASRGQERRAAAARLEKVVESEVLELAMKIRFQVSFAGAAESGAEAAEHWGPTGWDRIRFFAATNPGEPLKPLADIASGGELSRLLLALQVAIETGRADAAKGANGARRARRHDPEAGVRTLVFDEIDAGIGGRAAEAVGRKLYELGRRHQVLCVTHLAQIATYAQHHLHVEKRQRAGRAVIGVTALADTARVEEVARMLSGELSPAARQHASELLRRSASGG